MQQSEWQCSVLHVKVVCSMVIIRLHRGYEMSPVEGTADWEIGQWEIIACHALPPRNVSNTSRIILNVDVSQC